MKTTLRIKSHSGRRVAAVLIFAASLLLIAVITANAVDIWSVISGNDDLKTCYANNAKILKNHSIGSDILRYILWGITSLLAYVAHLCGGLYDKAFGFIDWTTNPKINAYVESFKPLFIALMVISLVYLGIVLIVQHEKKPNIMINIMLAVLCVTCSTALFSQLNSFTMLVKENAVDVVDDKELDQAYATVGTNIVDLVATDKANSNGLLGMNYSKKPKPAGIARLSNLSENQFDKMDFNEVLNNKSSRHSYKADTKRVLEHRLITDSSGDKIVSLNNGFGWNSDDDADIGNEFYYRYYFDWLSAWLELIALMLIYLTMSYKCIRVIFELIVGRLLAYLYSAELSGGEKLKKILVFIRDSYILLLVTALCIKVYFFMNAMLSDYVTGIVKGLFLLFLAFSVIDGPNLVEKLLGMDAGLRSSTARWLAVGRAVSGIGRGLSAKSLANTAQNIKSGDMSKGGLMAGAVGAVAGKEVMDKDGGTHREGGILNSVASSGNKAGSDASAASSTGQGAKEALYTQHSSNQTETIQGQGIKGDKGDRGDRGFDGRDGKEYMDSATHQSDAASSFEPSRDMDRSSHSFMDSGRSGSGSGYDRESSSMPKRSISSSSKFLDNKDEKGK